MQALKNHHNIIESYKKFLTSFFNIADERIAREVKKKFGGKSSTDSYLPEPLIQFNPAYKTGIALENIQGTHTVLKNILGKYNLYHHQVEAIQQSIASNDFVVTSGTGLAITRETRHRSGKYTFDIPFGAGLKIALNEGVHIRVEYLQRITFSNLIDGIDQSKGYDYWGQAMIGINFRLPSTLPYKKGWHGRLE